jgi:two-component system OmpR family sensor kinase
MPLRWRLTLWHVCLVAVGLAGFILVSYQVLSDSLRAEIDRTLEERAHHVTDALAALPTLTGIPADATDEFNSAGVYVQIVDAQGAVIAHSRNLAAQRLSFTGDELQRILAGGTSYATIRIDGQPVRPIDQPLTRNGVIVGMTQVGQSLAALESVLGQLRAVYAGGMVAVFVFAVFGGWALAQLGLQPLTRVTQAAREVVGAADLSRRVTYSGPADEVGALATTFNEMLDRLQALFEGQRRFLAEAAHELRTPLASMLGNVDLLVRFGEEPERRQTSLAALQRTGRPVSRLLDDLLLLAQAESGWHLQLRPVAIDDVFMEAHELIGPTRNGAAVQIETCDSACVRRPRPSAPGVCQSHRQCR